MDSFVETMREIGQLTGDASVGRGIAVSTGAALAVGGAVWGWFRRRKPTLIKHNFSAPPGTKMTMRIGDEEDK